VDKVRDRGIGTAIIKNISNFKKNVLEIYGNCIICDIGYIKKE